MRKKFTLVIFILPLIFVLLSCNIKSSEGEERKNNPNLTELTEFEKAFAASQTSSFTIHVTFDVTANDAELEDEHINFIIIFQENRFYLQSDIFPDNFIEIIDNQYYLYVKSDDNIELHTAPTLGELLDEWGIFRFDNLANFKEDDFTKVDSNYICDLIIRDSFDPYLDNGTRHPDPNVTNNSLKIIVKITDSILDTIKIEILEPDFYWSCIIILYTFSSQGSSIVQEPLWVVDYKNNNS